MLPVCLGQTERLVTKRAHRFLCHVALLWFRLVTASTHRWERRSSQTTYLVLPQVCRLWLPSASLTPGESSTVCSPSTIRASCWHPHISLVSSRSATLRWSIPPSCGTGETPTCPRLPSSPAASGPCRRNAKYQSIVLVLHPGCPSPVSGIIPLAVPTVTDMTAGLGCPATRRLREVLPRVIAALVSKSSLPGSPGVCGGIMPAHPVSAARALSGPRSSLRATHLRPFLLGLLPPLLGHQSDMQVACRPRGK